MTPTPTTPNKSLGSRFGQWLTAWRVPLISAAIMTVVTSLPYIYGYLITPADRVFTGIVTRTPDIAQYLAWLQGFKTANLIPNQLTPETNEAVFFNLLWWLLAKITVLFNADPLVVTQGYRIFSIFTFALALYWFIKLVLPEPRRLRGAFLTAYFAGGLGWVWVIVKYLLKQPDVAFPRDLYVAENNSFLAALGFNHFSISLALMLVVYGLFLLGYERKQWRTIVFASLAAIVLGWEHAYDILLMDAILGVFVLALIVRDGFQWRPVLYLFVIGITSCWPSLYSLYITRSFPVWKAVLAQFDNAGAWTPDPFHLIFLLGLPFVAALLGFTGIAPIKSFSQRELFVRLWFLTNFFLIYIPLNFQIHYLNGLQVPLAILAAAVYFDRMLPWLVEQPRLAGLIKRFTRPRFEAGVGLAVFGALILVNVYLLAWQFLVVKRLPHDNVLYKDEVAALDWLAQHAKPDDVVFSDTEVGQYVPSRTGARAFLAHWAMTMDLYKKLDLVQAFYNPATPDADRRALLKEYSVDYVLYGTQERDLGQYDPSTADFLEPCFTSPQATVYCVRSTP